MEYVSNYFKKSIVTEFRRITWYTVYGHHTVLTATDKLLKMTDGFGCDNDTCTPIIIVSVRPHPNFSRQTPPGPTTSIYI